MVLLAGIALRTHRLHVPQCLGATFALGNLMVLGHQHILLAQHAVEVKMWLASIAIELKKHDGAIEATRHTPSRTAKGKVTKGIHAHMIHSPIITLVYSRTGPGERQHLLWSETTNTGISPRGLGFLLVVFVLTHSENRNQYKPTTDPTRRARPKRQLMVYHSTNV